MSDAQALIETRALIKAYDMLVVLRKLDLRIERGEFVALLGPNGSGKSTLLRLLCGLTRPTSGTILIGGWELPGEAAAVRAQIGMVSHKSLLYENLTARENLRFFARLYHLPARSVDTHIDDLLKQVGLYRRADSLVRTFSRGMQQRLSIARALLHEPDVLLFDEPYTGLDQDAARTLDDLLLQAHADGHTIIMTTHELERAARLAGRVLILNRGAVGYDAPAHNLTTDQLAIHYADLTGMTASA
ncbi:MAG: heme ABC exporter ATP-binding protein CcmA [Anaerolineaceae bacterium]|nr:heme ABC exporter ATP-binding protein CcmA [Anaerolineaceae bacterium]